MDNHRLTREIKETKEYNMQIINSLENNEEKLIPDYDSGVIVSTNEKRIECSCGKKFNKEKKALEHIKNTN